MSRPSCNSLSGTELTEEIVELRAEVLEYEPGKSSTCADRVEFPNNLYIGLFGQTGCGKTSLINSLKFAANGRLRKSKWLQAAGQEKAGGHTMFRKLADITKKIYVIDNRGLDEPNTENAIKELTMQLDGKRGYSEKVKWEGGNDDDEDNDEDLDLGDVDLGMGHPIGCAVFVFSASHDIDTNINKLADVVDIVHQHQGSYPLAIITHVDVAEKDHVDTLKAVLRVSGVSDIFEVANLTTDKLLLEEPYQHSLLSLLERCMTDGDATLIFKHYQRKEQQRKREIEMNRKEKRLKQEEERQAKERRQNAEKERIMRENRMLQELEEHKREKERQRQRSIELELEHMKREIELERQKERERREEERERCYQESIRRFGAEKQEEIARIMSANKKREDNCAVM